MEKRSDVDGMCVCGGVRGWRGRKVSLDYASKLKRAIPEPREEHS